MNIVNHKSHISTEDNAPKTTRFIVNHNHHEIVQAITVFYHLISNVSTELHKRTPHIFSWFLGSKAINHCKIKPNKNSMSVKKSLFGTTL